MDGAQQVRAANLFMKRLFLKNPLLHEDMWPVSLAPSRNSRTGWREVTFESLDQNDFIEFPKLHKDLINPVAIELTSGPHAISRADSVLTYMSQLLLKGRGLTRGQTVQALQDFPNAWKVSFTEIKSP